MYGKRFAWLPCGIFATTAIALALNSLVSAKDLIRRDYPGFSLEVDCDVKGPVSAYYQIGPDEGDEKSKKSFHPDKELRPDCRQTSTATYNAPKEAPFTYDRGHLVPANHMDNDSEAITSTYVMTNIVPQASVLNGSGGAWRKTEDLIECWREDGPLEVWIGVVWGSNTDNDHFVDSHGIATPDKFVKLVHRRKASKAIAWELPNEPIRSSDLDARIVAPKVVEAVIGTELYLPGVDKTRKANAADWPERKPCDIK